MLNNTQGSEDFPLTEVPAEQRKGFWSLLWVLTGFTLFVSTMFAGSQIGTSFKFFPDLVLVIVLGNIILGTYAAILGHVAAKTGLNTVLLARFSFGDWGSKIVDLALGLTQVLWYAWGTGIIAEWIAKAFGIDSHFAIYAMMIFFGFAFCITAFVGYRGLEILALVAVPLMLVLIIVSIFIATQDAAALGGINNIPVTGSLTFLTALAVVVGTFISGGTQATNWSRFAKTPKDAIITTLIAFLVINGLMLFIGAYGSLIYQVFDIADIFIAQGLLVLGFIMLFLNIWTTQDNTIYNFSVAGSNFLRTEKRKLITLGGAAIGTLLALFGFHNAIVPFALFLSTFIPPIGGIVMADFFVVNKGKYPTLNQASLSAFNYSGLLAYIGACAFAGWASYILGNNGIALLGVIVAFVIHSLLGNILGKK